MAAREEVLLEAIIGRRPDGIFLTGILPPGKGRTRLLASYSGGSVYFNDTAASAILSVQRRQ